VWYDSVGRLALFSEAFYIHTLGIEFAAGIAQHPDTGEILVSFGLADRESWIARFSPNAIKRILQPAGQVMSDLGDITDTLWIMTETNQALKSQEKIVRAAEISKRAGIRSHEDQAKNWDNLVSILHTTMTCDPNLPVMDVAATEGSSYLQTLARFGYQNLVSINIDEPNPRTVGGVTYQAGDCTKTDFPDNYFGFVSCLSVIEHGVDVAAFMQESARILRPGAHLLVSTDYWQDPVDTYGQQAFGAPVKVFTMQDIVDMIKTAAQYGLEITSNVDLSCSERVVNWIGMDYTFINLLFRKTL
jgi:hypothetical protein